MYCGVYSLCKVQRNRSTQNTGEVDVGRFKVFTLGVVGRDLQVGQDCVKELRQAGEPPLKM